jgi:membrane protease YdiL (CAAX protease family)
MAVADTTRQEAALDLLIIVGVLIVSKSLLLRIDQIWAFAGPISLLLTLAFAHWRLGLQNIRWSSIGLTRPKNVGLLFVYTVLALIVTIIAGEMAGMVASAWFGPPDAITQGIDARYQDRFRGVAGNPLQFVLWLAIAWIIGGFTEEVLFRGALFARLEALFLGVPLASLLAGVGQAVLFGQQHYYYQGSAGWVATAVIALISSLLYLVFRRNLVPLILSHGISNSIGLTLLFLQNPS